MSQERPEMEVPIVVEVEHLIKPIHLSTTYQEWYDTIEQIKYTDASGHIKRDLIPLQFAWEALKEDLETFYKFCEFVNHNEIENWVFDDPPNYYIRFRLSSFKEHAKREGLGQSVQFMRSP
jgi:hypothetical protein